MPEVIIKGNIQSTEVQVPLILIALRKIYKEDYDRIMMTFNVRSAREFVKNINKFKELFNFYKETVSCVKKKL